MGLGVWRSRLDVGARRGFGGHAGVGLQEPVRGLTQSAPSAGRGSGNASASAMLEDCGGAGSGSDGVRALIVFRGSSMLGGRLSRWIVDRVTEDG